MQVSRTSFARHGRALVLAVTLAPLTLPGPSAASFPFCKVPLLRSPLLAGDRNVGTLTYFFRRHTETGEDQLVADVSFLTQKHKADDCVPVYTSILHTWFNENAPTKDYNNWDCHEVVQGDFESDRRVVCDYGNPSPLEFGKIINIATHVDVVCADEQVITDALSGPVASAVAVNVDIESDPMAAYFPLGYCEEPLDRGPAAGDVFAPGSHWSQNLDLLLAAAPNPEPTPDPEPTRVVDEPVAQGASRAALLAPDGTHYATAGRDGYLKAHVTAASGWEGFWIESVEGGPVVSGASVSLKTFHGSYWTAGADGSLNADADAVGADQTFIIEKIDAAAGAAIAVGDRIALRGAHGTYVSAVHFGGGQVHANGPAISGWERFTLVALP